MVLDCVFYHLLSAFIFLCLAGNGILVLRLLKIKFKNIFLSGALAFFISTVLYVLSQVILLFFFKEHALLVLKIFTLLYSVLSLAVLSYCGFNILHKKYVSDFIRRHWPVFVIQFFILTLFFLGIYQTALLDEWLHRPIVKFFMDNGEFPLQNPLNQSGNIMTSYHYGLYILASAIGIFFEKNASEALDILKMSFVLASYYLFYGLIYYWSNRKLFSILASFFILFSGASFFLFDSFSTTHWFYWGQQIRTMNYPMLYSLMGITWVNLPMGVALTYLVSELFYRRKDYSMLNIFLLGIILAGFFLISELFGIFILLLFVLIAGINLFKGRLSWKKITFLLLLLAAILGGGIFATKGVMSGVFENKHFDKLADLRSPDNWGYPDERHILKPLEHPFLYLRNFLLEIFIVITLIYLAIRKKIGIFGQPLILIGSIVCFIIPFVVSTSMGDLNLYKLAHLGQALLYLSFFYVFSRFKKGLCYYTAIILFLFASIPLAGVFINIQFGNSELAQGIRCVQNPLCYEDDPVKILGSLQESDHGIKNIFAHENDTALIVDISNSVVFTGISNFSLDYLKKNNIDYIFVSPNSKKIFSAKDDNLLNKFAPAYTLGDYEILKVNRNVRDTSFKNLRMSNN